jgi:hypothetical protein
MSEVCTHIDPIAKADKARAPTRLGLADAVVAHRHRQHLVLHC